MSDLHMEFVKYQPAEIPSVGEEVVVLAGDIGVGIKGVQWAKNAFAGREVIYVLGNHEFYDHHWIETIDQCRRSAEGSIVHLLENDSVEIGGILFLGCSLWSDFRAFGIENEISSRVHAFNGMRDFDVIAMSTGWSPRKITTEDVVVRHNQCATWLSNAIDSSSPPWSSRTMARAWLHPRRAPHSGCHADVASTQVVSDLFLARLG